MIHPTAIIDNSAQIDEGVEIGPYAVLEGPVRIGRNCRIMAHAWIGGDTTLGEGCVVHPFAALGGLPQDFSYNQITMHSGLQIGKNSVFREGVTVHRSAHDGGTTYIGHHVYMMACSHVGHDAVIGNHVTMANSALLAGHVVVGDRAFISGNVSVHQHAHIGCFAMIGASSFISQDIPLARSMFRPGSCVSIRSVPRNGYDQERRFAVKRLFRLLYRQGLALAAVLKNSMPSGARMRPVLRNLSVPPKRGIAAGRPGKRS